MTAPREPRAVTLTVGPPRPFRTGSGLRLASIGAARALVSLPRRALSVLFPRQGPPPPIVILPGHAALLTVDISAPGRDLLHVYPEVETLMGATRIDPDAPQAVPLDRNGRARIWVTVTPRDMRTTGQAALRLVAVDPERPDAVAGEASGIMLTQQGTETLLRTLLAILVLVGLTLQVWLTEIPVLALMIVVALGMIMLNAPRKTGARFEPRRLLRPRGMLRAAGLTALGVLVWAGAMGFNIRAETLQSVCSTPVTNPCGWDYAVFDNATSILASLGFAFLALTAWAPAIRPAALVGQLALFAGLAPLLVYDLTLLPALISDDGRDTLWLATEALIAGYPALGWTLSGFGIWLVMQRNGLGTARQRLVPVVVGVIGVAAMVLFSNLAFHIPGQESIYMNETVTRRLFGVLLVIAPVWVLVRRALVPIPRRRPVLRWGFGGLVLIGATATLMSDAAAFVSLSDGWGIANSGGVDHVIAAAGLLLLAIGLSVVEVLRWTRRQKRAATSDTSDPAATVPPAAGESAPAPG